MTTNEKSTEETSIDSVKVMVVSQLNEKVFITLRRHELVRIGQIMNERLGNSPPEDYAYEYSIWEKIIKAVN